MRRILSALFLALILIASQPLITPAQGQETVSVLIDGLTLNLDVAPVIQHGRTLVPFRAIAEAMNIDVSWDNPTRTVNATDGNTTVGLQIDNRTAYRNNTPMTLDAAPQIVGGRTLIPLPFFNEAFHCQVDWNSTINQVSIISPHSTTDVLYKNDKFGFSLLMPKDFRDAVEIKGDGNFIYFVNKEMQAFHPEFIIGTVGRIEIYDKEKFTKEIITANADIYGLRYLGENEKYYFGWAHATDVQVPTEASQQLKDQFRPMEAKFDEIIKTFKIINTSGINLSNEQEQIKDNFYESVNYDPGQDLLSFTIPKIVPEGYKFYLHVSGRMFMGDKSNGMSFHAFDEESQNYSWEKGKTYTYSLKSENLDECMLVFGLIDINNQELIYTIHIFPDGTNSIANPEQLLSFIKDYDEKTRMLTFDEIEWVMKADKKRVNELGLDAELDFPNGYYIYNESEQKNSLKVSDDVKVNIVNWHDLANPSLTDVNGLTKRMAEYEAPYHLTIKDGVIVEILEQYRP